MLGQRAAQANWMENKTQGLSVKFAAAHAKNLFAFYKIAHRIPGRIRLRIAALDKLPPDWYGLADRVHGLIASKNGIELVKIEPISGSVVLQYRPDVIKENDLICWLEHVVRKFVASIRRRDRLTVDKCAVILEVLKNRL